MLKAAGGGCGCGGGGRLMGCPPDAWYPGAGAGGRGPAIIWWAL